MNNIIIDKAGEILHTASKKFDGKPVKHGKNKRIIFLQGKEAGLRTMLELFIESSWLKPEYEEKCKRIRDITFAVFPANEVHKLSEREKLCYIICKLLKKTEKYSYQEFHSDLNFTLLKKLEQLGIKAGIK